MKRVAPSLQATLVELIANGAQGRLQSGDIVEIWIYNEQVRTDRFRPKLWTPELAPSLSEKALDFIEREHFEKLGHLERAVAEMDRAIQRCPNITVVLLTDGEEGLRGRPFSTEAGGLLQRRYRELRQARQPFVVTLEARDGKWAACTVSAPREQIGVAIDRIALLESVPPLALPPTSTAQPAEPPPTPATRQSVDLPEPKTPLSTTGKTPAPTQGEKPTPKAVPQTEPAASPAKVEAPVPAPPPTTSAIPPRSPDVPAPVPAPSAQTQPKPVAERESAPPQKVEAAPSPATSPQAVAQPANPTTEPAPNSPATKVKPAPPLKVPPSAPAQLKQPVASQQAALISPADTAAIRGFYVTVGCGLLVTGVGLTLWLFKRKRPAGTHSLISQSLDKKPK